MGSECADSSSSLTAMSKDHLDWKVFLFFFASQLSHDLLRENLVVQWVTEGWSWQITCLWNPLFDAGGLWSTAMQFFLHCFPAPVPGPTPLVWSTQ